MSVSDISVPSDNPNDYCRLCFSDRNLVALFPCDAEPRQLLVDQILQCTGIQIEEVENHPRSICWRCAVALEDFELFRQRSLAHDSVIRKTYSISTVDVTDGHTKWMISIPPPDAPSNKDEDVDEDDKSLIEPMLLVEPESSARITKFSSTKMNELNMGDSQSSKSSTCHLCKHDFVSRQSLYAHFKEQHSDRGRPHQCNLCNASFKRRSHLKDHVSSHTGEMRYSCKDCGAKYAKYKSLMRHQKLTHWSFPLTIKTVNKPAQPGGDFKCKYCPKSFKHRPSLSFHIRSHYDLLPHVCEFCVARFSNEKGKKLHIGRFHPRDVFKPVSESSKEAQKVIQCTLCPRYFEHRRYLTQHMKFKHPTNSEENNENIEDTGLAEQQSNQQGAEESNGMNDDIEPLTIKFEADEYGPIDGAYS